MRLGDSVPAQRNEVEVQENKSSRHNSVTAAVSNGHTTSQALRLSNPDRSQKQLSKTSDISTVSIVPVHCITPFCSDALVSHRPTFIRPAPDLFLFTARAMSGVVDPCTPRYWLFLQSLFLLFYLSRVDLLISFIV